MARDSMSGLEQEDTHEFFWLSGASAGQTILVGRVNEKIEHSESLSNDQYGFRTERSSLIVV